MTFRRHAHRDTVFSRSNRENEEDVVGGDVEMGSRLLPDQFSRFEDEEGKVKDDENADESHSLLTQHESISGTRVSDHRKRSLLGPILSSASGYKNQSPKINQPVVNKPTISTTNGLSSLTSIQLPTLTGGGSRRRTDYLGELNHFLLLFGFFCRFL